MSKIIVRFERDHGGIEVQFPKGFELRENDKAFLKKLGMAWHRQKHCYYTRYTAEKMNALRERLKDTGAQFPAKKLETEMASLAEKAEATAQAKRKPAKRSTSDELKELREAVAALTEAMALMARK